MPAAKPVRVAASMIVFTSLLSDMVIFWKYFFNCNSCGKIYTKICVLSRREKDVDSHCILHHQDKVLDTLHTRLLLHTSSFFSAQFGGKTISLHTFNVFNVKWVQNMTMPPTAAALIIASKIIVYELEKKFKWNKN